MRTLWILSVGMFAMVGCGGSTGDDSLGTTEQDEVAREPMLRSIPVRGTGEAEDVGDIAADPTIDLSIGANVNASRERGAQSETDIAIDPTDPLHLLGGSNDIQAGLRMRVYESLDGGKSWTSKELPFNQQSGDPAVGFDLAGNAYYSFLLINGSTSLQAMKKPHGSSTWGELVTVPNVGADKDLMAVDQTSSAFKNSVYIAWDDNTATGQRIMLARSTNGGASYTAKKVNHTGANVIGAQPAVGPNGEVYVAWAN